MWCLAGLEAVHAYFPPRLHQRNVIQIRRHPGPKRATPLIQTHVDGYMLSLMLADLLQGLGAVTSAKWAAQGKVECGSYCVAQGKSSYARSCAFSSRLTLSSRCHSAARRNGCRNVDIGYHDPHFCHGLLSLGAT